MKRPAGNRLPALRRALVAAGWALLVLPGAAAAAGNEGAATAAATAAPAAPSSGFLQGLLAGAGDEEPRFLHPDEAFRLEVAAQGPAGAFVRWRIEPGYYLYRKRIGAAFAGEPPSGTTLSGVELPPGEAQEDPYFGPVEVFRTEAVAAVRLAHAGAPPRAVELAVVYQGCADAGLCYPPVRKVVALPLDAGGAGAGWVAVASAAAAGPGGAGAGGAAFAAADLGLSETDRIARSLSAGGLLLVLAAFFGFGLALAFTPCVFPMIPILSSLLVAEGRAAGPARGLLLSFAYVLASALTYAAVGSIAGLLGENVQLALQNPWALGAVSAVFVALALSMFGLYELQLPSAWQSRLDGWMRSPEGLGRRRGGYPRALAMGFVSALVVGPCVAAPLAGAVLYIGQAGDPLRGALALFALGLGMGAPLLALGASAGRLLPRAGQWMEAVRQWVGVVLLGVAAFLLERVLPSWAALAAWALVVSAAALLLVRAARALRAGAEVEAGDGAGIGAVAEEALPAARRRPGMRRAAAAAGALASALYALALLTGAVTGAADPLRPLAGVGFPPERPALEFAAVKGLGGPDGLEAALVRAGAEGRPVMLEFYADWCVSCKEMEDSTFRDPRVRAALGDALLLRADVTANDERDRALMKRLGVLGPPAILFFGPDRVERRRYRTVGFVKAGKFAASVTGALTGAA